MSLKEFLDAAYTVLVERFRDLPDVTLPEALDMAAPWRAGAREGEEEEQDDATAGGSSKQYATSETARRAKEERELAEFDAMMAGTVSRRA